MAMEEYPTFKDRGDAAFLQLLELLHAQARHEHADLLAVAHFLAAAYQKSLELQFVVDKLLEERERENPAEMAELLATAELAAAAMAQWHQESRGALVSTVDGLRHAQGRHFRKKLAK